MYKPCQLSPQPKLWTSKKSRSCQLVDWKHVSHRGIGTTRFQHKGTYLSPEILGSHHVFCVFLGVFRNGTTNRSFLSLTFQHWASGTALRGWAVGRASPADAGPPWPPRAKHGGIGCDWGKHGNCQFCGEDVNVGYSLCMWSKSFCNML